MSRLGIGIVGAGFAADFHARALRDLAGLGVAVVGVASRRAEKAAEFAARYGIPASYDGFEELLNNPAVDVVDLCVPNALHHPFAVAARRAGKHVICEKPLTAFFGRAESTGRAEMFAQALQQADEMLDATRQNHVKLLYAENWVYAPAIVKARRLIVASGAPILEIRAVEAHSGSHSPYAMSWEHSGGGALLRLGAHPIGAAIHLKRYEGLIRDGKPITVKSVMADVDDLTRIPAFQAESRHWIATGWQDVENWAVMILTFSDGARGIFSASDIALGGIEAWMHILLSNGRIQCNLPRNDGCETFAPDGSVWGGEYLAEKLETKAGWNFASVDEQFLLGYLGEMRDFVEAIQEDREPLSNGQLARATVEAIYGAYLAAERGEKIELAAVGSGANLRREG